MCRTRKIQLFIIAVITLLAVGAGLWQNKEVIQVIDIGGNVELQIYTSSFSEEIANSIYFSVIENDKVIINSAVFATDRYGNYRKFELLVVESGVVGLYDKDDPDHLLCIINIKDRLHFPYRSEDANYHRRVSKLLQYVRQQTGNKDYTLLGFFEPLGPQPQT